VANDDGVFGGLVVRVGDTSGSDPFPFFTYPYRTPYGTEGSRYGL
jgi:hypothetical protein